MEHRWGQRIPVRIPVLIGGPGVTPRRACTENLSLSGVLLRITASELVPPTTCVQFRLPDTRVPRRSVRAYVVRQLPGFIALEWAQFAPEIIRFLLREDACRAGAGRDDRIRRTETFV